MRRTRSTIATTAGTALIGVGLALPTGATAATAAAPDACADASSSCRIVSRADVDGDGRRDSVGQTTWGTKITTRLATADGEKTHVVTELEYVPGSGYYGAARIDGEDGYEIVTRTSLGAHTAYHQVLTYRDGKLKTLKDPRNRYRWVTDGSVWSSAGYQKTTTATGAFTFVSRQAIDSDRDGDFTLYTVSAGWNSTDRTWRRMGTSSRYDVSPEVASRYSWWNVPYLPRGI